MYLNKSRPPGYSKYRCLIYFLLVFKALSMGEAPENQTAGNGEQDDHIFFHDVTSHLGSDTRNDRDNKTFTQHNSTSSAPDKKYPVL